RVREIFPKEARSSARNAFSFSPASRLEIFPAAMSYTEIPGGVTAAQGFLAGSAYCGIKAGNSDRPDIALIHSPGQTVAAGTFTTNRVKAAPVRLSMTHLRTGDVRAI